MQRKPFKNTQYFVNIAILIFTFLSITFFISSCEKEEDFQDIPSYIKVMDFNLVTSSDQGKDTENITDIWVFANDQPIGTFELPSTIPILEEDSTKIQIFAGIKDNGISATRIRYPFYKSVTNTYFLSKDSITNITPIFHYSENTDFEIEDFEGVGVDLDTSLNSEIGFEIKTEGDGNKYASAILDGNYLTFEAVTNDFENLPQVGAPVYLEMDYKCNHEIEIGAYINYLQYVETRDLVKVTPKEEWHKIYINMTKTVSEAINNKSIKFYINLHRNDTTENAWLKLDNLKIVY